MKNQSLIVNWNYPTRILVGAGRINELAKACRDLGMNAPLLVTDPGLASSLMVSKVIQQAQASGLRTGLFCQIKTNPTGDNVMNGVCAFKAGQHDGVIAFGGGSALDAGKAIALMVGQDRSLWDFEDVGDNWTRVNVSAMAPVLAIPTTAGTGSEVGRASVITDAEKQVKKIIFHPKMLPAMVILDPELTVGLPKLLTAATGMDALSHCLEAYCSNYYHPMAESIALEGIRLIKENLIQAYKDGSDLEARTHMLVASAMGATAFQRGLGAMHALAHPLGAIYDIHHGRLNAVLMPYVLLANRSEIENKIEHLANYLSIANGFDGFLDWIEQMRLELGIENTLSQLGIDHSQIDRLAKMATEDAAAASNPVLFTFEQYKELLSKAIGE
ncbi:TPA: iron-containing alcohol dehydrogenase [Legionella pneumophila subsp. pneumophila]|uniref:iron-containing alcohol dehydrogenase n=1 Tax=Legionella pneumophila TaxID=446 RepID=UPI0007706EAD|nr:iron-containing alcohol dehydrogenase [Legionella pneumophila]HAT9214261.1 iron-containing alcohol dehydrogenase [Legionella pneumophila subsp. pneumophila]CZI61951.1 NAD-dependent methanol dehydrogenase [Legionella pneumophila]HAT9260577.1 iron-containing alcohol dehydrogenase [Legionella pneumophila subsp. pneumophila]HAT9282747.1 iron-containing alcohol dehydrogenase [Legionella pneumophila subsp. pneumophila]HAT9289044.1 iron-containing alcohol dehydrogenase [Legionella pneumophila subs